MILQEVLNKTIQFFKEKKIESARLDAETLVANALGLQRIELYTNFSRPLSEPEVVKCREYLKRRVGGEPVAYITEKRGFYRNDFYVNSNVLIPRPETETLVEEVLNFFSDHEKPANILDLGTGSGILSCTFARELPNARVMAVDISVDALNVARKNAETLGVSDRIEFIDGDAGTDVVDPEYKFDIIVSNPPYIAENDPEVEENVKKFEPSIALFAPEGGLYFINRWAHLYANRLKNPGIMIFEIGKDQGQEAANIFKQLNVFTEVTTVKDLAGHDRFVRGILNG